MGPELDLDLYFLFQKKSRGNELFELVCRTIGLRETWFFGLQYVDSKGYIAWLRMEKKVLRASVYRRVPIGKYLKNEERDLENCIC